MLKMTLIKGITIDHKSKSISLCLLKKEQRKLLSLKAKAVVFTLVPWTFNTNRNSPSCCFGAQGTRVSTATVADVFATANRSLLLKF